MIITKGKTKVIKLGPTEGTVLLETEDVLTGGDAAKQETITGIGVHKTTQAANVFSLLNKRGIPTAFIKRASANALLCHQCEMLPLELVIRRYAWGSYLLRHPDLKKEGGSPHRFDDLVWEIFHKRSVVSLPISDIPYQIDEGEARERFLSNGIWQEGVYTDPYILIEGNRWLLYSPKKEVSKTESLMSIEPLLSPDEIDEVINSIMLPTFLALEDAWLNIITSHGPVALVDLKVEVGRRLSDNKIVLADVIDNDSWRIWPGADPSKQLDKQCFREGHPLSQVAEKYALVAELTERFVLDKG